MAVDVLSTETINENDPTFRATELGYAMTVGTTGSLPR